MLTKFAFGRGCKYNDPSQNEGGEAAPTFREYRGETLGPTAAESSETTTTTTISVDWRRAVCNLHAQYCSLR